MDLALEKCLQITFQGVSNQMKALGGKLNSKLAIEDLGVTVQKIFLGDMLTQEFLRRAKSFICLGEMCMRKSEHA